jgi:hypothetical protein
VTVSAAGLITSGRPSAVAQEAFKFFIPWQPRKLAKGSAQRLHLFADHDVPTRVVLLLREVHRVSVMTAHSAGMERHSDRRIFDYCRQHGLILVSFNVKDYWRMPLDRSFGMFLLDVSKDSYRDVERALSEFFRHNGTIGRRNYTQGMLKLTTRGYVMKYLYRGQPYQVEAQYRGERLYADFMAMP